VLHFVKSFYIDKLSNLLDIQFIYLVILTDSITIGIKPWFTPQISLHCPKKTPSRLIKTDV